MRRGERSRRSGGWRREGGVEGVRDKKLKGSIDGYWRGLERGNDGGSGSASRDRHELEGRVH